MRIFVPRSISILLLIIGSLLSSYDSMAITVGSVNMAIPTVVLSTAASSPVNQAFTVTIAFSEAVTGFTIGDMVVSNATLSNLQTTDNITYTVLVTPAANGVISISVPASVAVNISNEDNTASNTLNLTYDSTDPDITSVTVPPGGYYKTGDVLTFIVNYSENVIVNTAGGTPYLNLIIGGNTRPAAYISGSGTSALTFSYTIQPGERDVAGIGIGTNMVLNGGTVQDAATNNAAITLQNLSHNPATIFVNAIAPTVVVSTTAPSQVNQPFTITITFSEAVTGLVPASIVSTATLSNLQTTDNITYTALITPSADGAVLIYVPADAAIDIDNNGNTVSNTLTLTYDHTGPVITSVAVPANGYYKTGATLDFTVNYSENVKVNGMPTLPVTIGSAVVQAAYLSDTGTNVMVFRYTVQSGDLDMDGISLGTSLVLNGATIQDAATNNATLALNNAGSTAGVFVNTAIPTVVLSTTTAAVQANVPFTVTLTFSEAVTGLTVADIIASNATLGNLQTTDNIAYTLSATPVANNTVSLSIPANAALNAGGNGNTASNTLQLDFVNQAPTLDAIAAQSICATTTTHTISLTGASAIEPGQTYTITATADQSYFDVLNVNTAGVLNYQLKAGITSGTATITVTIKDNGGTANGGVDTLRRTFTITINSLPQVSISSDKGTTVSKGDLIQLTATGGATYSWDNADGIISGQQSAVLTVKPQTNTTYQVTATTAAGCSNTAAISIAVVDDFKVDATNILTPNGDGKNDKWVVRNLDSYPDNEVKIYDRTGRMIYQRRNYSNDWEGTVNGRPLGEGTYYYILTINGGVRTTKGYITIIRDQH